MNNPNPLVPQGSMLEEKARNKTSLPVAFFIFFALHVIVLGGVLMVGCKKEDQPQQAKNTLPPLTNDLPPIETNALYTPPPTPTNSLAGTPPPGAGLPASNAFVAPAPAPSSEVPPSGAANPPPEAPGGTEYVVAKNDTFAIIAKKNHTTIKAIEHANPGVKSNKLKVGQKLVVPAGAAAPAKTAGAAKETESSPGGGATSVHVVKPGDNLTKIAKSHGVTTKAIRTANNLKTDRIVVGQKLKVPDGKPAPSADATPAATPAPPANTTPAFPTPTGTPRS